jgi:hypothetical protein
VKPLRGGRRGCSVVQPLHRSKSISPTRCHAMVAESSRDWSVFKQIFVAHWEAFPRVPPRSQTASYDGWGAKMLDWGNPAKIGDIASCGLHGGQGKHLVAMSCTSSLCLRCAKV